MELPQLAEYARLATPLARFGKVGRAASKQRVGVRVPPGAPFLSILYEWPQSLDQLRCGDICGDRLSLLSRRSGDNSLGAKLFKLLHRQSLLLRSE